MRASIYRHASTLALLSTLGLLTGCLEDMGVTRFTDVPTAVPPQVQFQDRNGGELIGGPLRITPANDGQVETDKWTFDSYVVQWAINGAVLPSDMFFSNIVGRVDRTAEPLQLNVYNRPPNGANSMVISTANPLGIAQQGQVIYFDNLEVDPRVPSILAKPRSVAFDDANRTVTIGGANLTFIKPATYNKCTESGCVQITDTEGDITEYVVRYADSTGCPIVTDEIARIPKASVSTYQYFVGAAGVVVYPPRQATSIVVIPANQYGEAYSENCTDYARTNPALFNEIWETRFPHFGPENAYLTPDEDTTETYTGYLVIKPSIDERDLLSGYYVTLGVTTSNAVNTLIETFLLSDPRNEQGEYRLRLEKWLPPALGDGSRPPMDNMVFYVAAGDNYTSGNRVKTAYMKNAHVVGSWFLINEEHEESGKTSEYCIKADALNSKIYKAKCDKYDVQQRFVVENAGLTNDDFHYIKSMAFDNACIYRQDDAGAPNWELRTCNSAWNTQIEIKAYNRHDQADIINKKIAVNHDAGWTCLAHYSITDDLSSPWGNCGIVTAQIYWRFLRAGKSNDFGLFNDPYVPE